MPKVNSDNLSIKTLLSLVVLLLIGIVVLYRLSQKPDTTISAAWFDDTYGYRQTISFTHNAALTNQSIGITINTSTLVSAGKMQSDCDDSRFVDYTGDVLNYQLLSGCNTSATSYKVVFPTITNGTNTAYFYYGSPLALTLSKNLSSYTNLSLSGGAPSTATEQKGTSPILHFELDEGYGSTVYDSVGTGTTGTLGTGTSAPTWLPSPSCVNTNCLNFDGSNDYVQIGTTIAAIQSVSFWVKPLANNQPLLSLGTGASLSIDSNNQLTTGGFSSPTTYVNARTTTNLVLNTWQFVTVTTQTGFTGSLNYLSRIGSTYGQNTFDDLKIFNYSLSAAQVKSAYYARGNNQGSSANLGNLDPGTTAPVAYFNFEERTGTTVYDRSSSGNSGALTSSPTWVQGKYGGALQFDGTAAYVRGNTPSVNIGITGDVTVEAWVYRDVGSSNTTIAEYASNGETEDTNEAYSLLLNSNNRMALNWEYNAGTDTGVTSTTTMSITSGAWAHYAATRNATGKYVTFYENGIQIGNTVPYTNNATGSTNIAQRLDIGRDASSGSNYFDGKIDEVKIYNYVRTAKQISADMATGGFNAETATTYWKLNDGRGSSGFDSTGNSNTLTLATGSSSPSWVTGKVGVGLSFGGNDYATAGNVGGSNTDLSFSFWVKPSYNWGTQTAATAGAFDTNPSANGAVRIFAGGSGTIRYDLGGAATPCSVTIGDWTNTWHHLVLTISSSTNETLYIDGKIAGSCTSSQNMANTTFNLGRFNTTNYFQGVIDEFKIFPFTLSSSDVEIEYNAGAATSNSVLSTSSDEGFSMPTPVGYWRFDEGVGTTTVENTGTGNSGSLTSSATWTQGKIDKGISLPGTNQAVVVANNSAYNFGTSSFTVSVWFKTTGSLTSYPRIISKGYFGGTDGYKMQMYPSSDQLSFGVGGGGSDANAYSATVPFVEGDGKWHHAVARIDGTKKIMMLFIDGVAQPLTVEAGVCGTVQNTYQLNVSACTISNATNNSQNLYFGSCDNACGDPNESLNGQIDEVSFYNTALTDAQISYLYNRGKPVVQLKFDECQGTTLYNSMGTGYTGAVTVGGSGSQTSVGTCSTASTAWGNGASGKYNSSLSLDGTDDYVQIADNDSLDIGVSMDFTASVWVNSSVGVSQDVWPVVAKKDVGGGSRTGWYMGLFDSNVDPRWFGQIWINGTSATVPGSSSVRDGTWHHLVLMRSGTQIKVYQDGKLANTGTVGTGTLANSDAMRLGSTGYGAPYEYPLNGKVDDFQFFNYALTDAQVKILYNQNSSLRFGAPTGTP